MKLKRKVSNNAGITLIALIITIVVLLILAVVTIRAVQGDGIIEQAKNATQRYSKAQIEETIGILQYQALLDSNGASSALTLDQINAQEWIKNGSASAVQDEATGDITITVPPTGEKVETIVVPGKIASSVDSIYGKYYALGSTEMYVELKENGDFEVYTGSSDETVTGTYSYDQSSNIIKLSWSDEEGTNTVDFNYSIIGTNKIIQQIGDSGRYMMYTSNGTEGFEIPADGKYTGTYRGNEIEVTISSGNITIENKTDPTGSYNAEGKTILLDGVILIGEVGVAESAFKVSGDDLIGYGFADGTTFTKVTE